MAEGYQVGDPQLVLGQDRLQRIMPALTLRPVPERAPPHPLARGPAHRPPFALRGHQIGQDCGRPWAARPAGPGHQTPASRRRDRPWCAAATGQATMTTR